MAGNRTTWPRGFDKDVSTVSAASSTFMGQNIIPSTSDPKILMQLLAYGITYNEAFASGIINSPRTLLITPTTAEVLAKGGYTKKKLIDDLVETARKPTYEWTFSKVYGSYGRIFGSFDRELQRELKIRAQRKGNCRHGIRELRDGKKSKRLPPSRVMGFEFSFAEIRAETRRRFWLVVGAGP